MREYRKKGLVSLLVRNLIKYVKFPDVYEDGRLISLKEITKDNIDEVLALKVDESQGAFVSSNGDSLAQAYVYPETAFPFAVYEDSTVVGFIMMGYYGAKSYYTLWKFMIDSRYQRRGYGRKALELGIKYLQDRFGVTEIYTGVIPDNTVAKKLYASIGFRETGLNELGMEEMCLELAVVGR